LILPLASAVNGLKEGSFILPQTALAAIGI
jgi:hypothetical protein